MIVKLLLNKQSTNLKDYEEFFEKYIDYKFEDFIGEYELGKRDIPGGCVNLSLLKQKDIDDVCW